MSSVTITSKNYARKPSPEVIFFDVNETLLDLSTLNKKVSDVLNGQTHLTTLWFTTLLHYSLVSTASGSYNDFGDIGVATLKMVAANNNITLTEHDAKKALSTITTLNPHNDVVEALNLLKDNDYTLVAITNSPQATLKKQMEYSGLVSYFNRLFSVENVGKFKPHTSVYNWAAKQLNVKPNACMLIAAHGWDIAGALAANWRAAFVARQGKQLYPIAPQPELVENDILKIAKQLITLS